MLERLHGEPGVQKATFLPIVVQRSLDALLRRKPGVEDEARRFEDLYVPLSPERGALAYLVACSLRAARIVELGISFASPPPISRRRSRATAKAT